MFVELHILQNFAPSNLNRDDTGAPKDCEFGGCRRARISSQCLKRAIRREPDFDAFLAGKGGVRTRRLILEIAQRLSGQRPPPEETVKLVSEVFKEGGIERPTAGKDKDTEKDNTKILVFMDGPAIDEMVSQVKARWPQLEKGDKNAREATVKQLGEILVKAVKAPDVALFGRMIEIGATTPFGKLQLNVDAACQVAHAISTHKISMEFDYYTAVDDLKGSGEDAGAGMIGTVEFNSACFYRYANVDLEQLKRNLVGKELDKATPEEHREAEKLARKTLEAFIRASVAAVPTGKQNSMAAQNPPSAVFAVARSSGLWSLANAFVKPVPPHSGDLVRESLLALDKYWGRLTAMYGDKGIAGKWLCALEGDGVENLEGAKRASMEGLVTGVMGTIKFEERKGGGK